MNNLKASISPSRPCVITIGSFDGLHLGHQSLFKKMREKAGKNGSVCIVTFINHPASIVSKEKKELLLSKDLKLKILNNLEINHIILLNFTNELANTHYDQFLKELYASCPFDLLLLGEGATLGKNREGTPEKIQSVGKKLGFSVEYIEKLVIDNEVVSSRSVRSYIKKGDLEKAARLLGRPYSLEGFVENGTVKFIPGICLPPDGIYSVIVEKDSLKTHSFLHIQKGSYSLDFPHPEGKIFIHF